MKIFRCGTCEESGAQMANDDIHDSDGAEESQQPKQPAKRRTQWLMSPATDPDQNHPANDTVEPNDLSLWMTEEEFLKYVDENCHLPPDYVAEMDRAKEATESSPNPTQFDPGFWAVGMPSKDRLGFLRVRAVHTKLKSGRYPVNTPPIRCRFVSSKNDMWISRPSLEKFIEQNGADLGISKQYQDLYSNDVHSTPVLEKKTKRERVSDAPANGKKKRRVQSEDGDS